MIRLLELRNERGFTQRQLAKEFFISQGTYNNWENGNTEPSVEQIIRIAEFFGVTTDFLLGKSSEEQSCLPQQNNKYRFLQQYEDAPEEVQQAILILLENVNK